MSFVVRMQISYDADGRLVDWHAFVANARTGEEMRVRSLSELAARIGRCAGIAPDEPLGS